MFVLFLPLKPIIRSKILYIEKMVFSLSLCFNQNLKNSDNVFKNHKHTGKSVSQRKNAYIFFKKVVKHQHHHHHMRVPLVHLFIFLGNKRIGTHSHTHISCVLSVSQVLWSKQSLVESQSHTRKHKRHTTFYF